MPFSPTASARLDRALPSARAILLAVATLLCAAPAEAQWTRQYPAVAPFGHQIYLEQEHLPILSSGPTYPAASPDGRTLAVAHQGWIWLLDLESRVATRLTSGVGLDARPRWSPDGGTLAFVRDEGDDTAIVLLTLSDRSERTIDTPAIDLDSEFTRDGRTLVYASARDGWLEPWTRDLETGADARLIPSSDPDAPRRQRVHRSARALADGRLVLLGSPGRESELRVMTPGDAADATGFVGERLTAQGWMVHFEPDVHPTESALVYGLADGNHVRLAVMDVDRPTFPRWLTPRGEKALFPTWSADGRHIYYVRADGARQFGLWRIGAAGGTPEPVAVERWDYGVPLGRLALAVRDAEGETAPARIAVANADGHPVVDPDGPTYVDNQNGPVYFYTDGREALDLPAGTYTVRATRGPFSRPASATVTVRAGQTERAALTVDEIWDARAAGYVSADHHIHLNASGVHELDLDDLLPLMLGERLDYAAPMAWNQYNRFVDADRIGDVARAPDGTTAMLSQEVRSDFHGHVGMIGASETYHPWFFGPGVPVYGDRDLSNGPVIPFAQDQGALPTYVHPADGDEDPFDLDNEAYFPYELVVDGVLADGLGLEVVCQWTSPYAAAAMWYRFLNIGRTMPATAGTDMMANFYRAPALGTARAFVPVTAETDGFDAAVRQVRAGRGFVTTGPAVLFRVGGSAPGAVTAGGRQRWALDVVSIRPVDRVEIVVNGEIVETLPGFAGDGQRQYEGEVDLPSGGWVAARAVGGETGWPTMAYAHFAHTQPVWIGERGSTEPQARRQAASDVLGALAHAERQFDEAYAGRVPPGLVARIAQARARLTALGAESR